MSKGIDFPCTYDIHKYCYKAQAYLNALSIL
jgi:hypothetical protein